MDESCKYCCSGRQKQLQPKTELKVLANVDSTCKGSLQIVMQVSCGALVLECSLVQIRFCKLSTVSYFMCYLS